ncbi:MAG: hypothetical protein HY673_07810 [Chloroflexi bacterium]|nr:hypothetical protein [Chloroflexota bacterium]
MTEEAKTLEELLFIHQATIPKLSEVVKNILLANPELTKNEIGGGVGINLDKFIAIAIMDFLCFAFNKSHLGYVRTYPKN